MADALFDNTKPATAAKKASPPKWVIDELVRQHGCKPQVVRTWHAGQAFAVMYGMRKKKESAGDRRKAVAAKLVGLAGSDDATARELHDLLTEAFVEMDSAQLAELCRVVAAILTPPT